MVELFLGHAKSTVDSLKLAGNCPKFKHLKLLSCRVQSEFREDSFQVFVSALGGTDSALTTENLNDLRLLCKRVEFSGFSFQSFGIPGAGFGCRCRSAEAHWWG
jgi:hypothetical protein